MFKVSTTVPNVKAMSFLLYRVRNATRYMKLNSAAATLVANQVPASSHVNSLSWCLALIFETIIGREISG
jgi:hypothetical protein